MAAATDDFNRANETPLAAPWATMTSETAFNLSSNQVVPSAGASDAGAVYNSLTWGDDQFSRATVSATGTSGGGAGIGVGLRMSTSARTYYRLVADKAATNNLEIAKLVSGTYTSLSRVTYSWTSGATFEGRAQGTTISFFVNGTLATSATDSAVASGNPGLSYSSTTAGSNADNWEAGQLVPAPRPLFRGS